MSLDSGEQIPDPQENADRLARLNMSERLKPVLDRFERVLELASEANDDNLTDAQIKSITASIPFASDAIAEYHKLYDSYKNRI